MAEASIIPYIIVIVAFVTLGILLALIRKKSDVIILNRKKTMSPVGPIVGTSNEIYNNKNLTNSSCSSKARSYHFFAL